jgi:hypothetical protein
VSEKAEDWDVWDGSRYVVDLLAPEENKGRIRLESCPDSGFAKLTIRERDGSEGGTLAVPISGLHRALDRLTFIQAAAEG